MDPDDLLTVAEVAAKLRTSTTYVYGEIHAGELIAEGVGRCYRVRAGDLADYRRKRRRGPVDVARGA